MASAASGWVGVERRRSITGFLFFINLRSRPGGKDGRLTVKSFEYF